MSELSPHIRTALDEIGSGLSGRAMTCETLSDGRDQVQIASDGLTIDEKLDIERALKAKWPDLSVYFKRKIAAQPAPSTGESPFGVKSEKRPIPGVRRVVIVASGKGGVGKSTVSANLAVALSQLGRRVGILDADLYGPSLPILFGLQGERARVSVDGRIEPIKKHNVSVMSLGFLIANDQALIWRGPMASKALSQLFYEVNWGDLDDLIVDLPPGTGDIHMTLMEQLPIDRAIVVTTPQDVALADAKRGIAMLQKLKVPITGIVENMSGHTCTQCGHVDHVFGAHLADSILGLPVLTRIPLAPQFCNDGDQGVPTVLRHPEMAQPFLNIALSLQETQSYASLH